MSSSPTSGSSVSGSSTTVSSASEKYLGRVKWFNNKSGFGFVTVTDGPKSGTDVFVHHSSIKVASEQYRYLVQGEYVEFTLASTKSDDHEVQAVDVCGVKGGKLMCETRNEVRSTRPPRAPQQTQSTVEVNVEVTEKKPRSVRAPKARGQGPRADAGEWTYVARNDRDKETTVKRARGRPPKSASSSVGAKE